MTVTRTYLHMESLASLRPADAPPERAWLQRLDPCPADVWRERYARIGGPWHWHDRDAWSDERLAQHLERREVRVFDFCTEGGTPLDASGGFVELERHADGAVEIVYLGLDTRLIGRRLGAVLLEQAAREAFALGATRVWLHTCTLDSSAALPNYLARGFVVDRTETYETLIHD